MTKRDPHRSSATSSRQQHRAARVARRCRRCCALFLLVLRTCCCNYPQLQHQSIQSSFLCVVVGARQSELRKSRPRSVEWLPQRTCRLSHCLHVIGRHDKTPKNLSHGPNAVRRPISCLRCPPPNPLFTSSHTSTLTRTPSAALAAPLPRIAPPQHPQPPP